MSDQPDQPITPPEDQQQLADQAKSKLALLFASRKFWAALIGLVLIIVKAYRPDFPLTADQLTGIVVVLVGYILGTAVEDHGAQRSIPSKDSAPPTPPRAG